MIPVQRMTEWLANLTAIRDVLLLFINFGVLLALMAIGGVLFLHHRRTRAAGERQAALLERLVDQPVKPDNGTPLGSFKTARNAPPRESGIGPDEMASLQQLLSENRETLQSVADSLQRERSSDPGDVLRPLIEQQRNSLRELLSGWNEEGARRLQATERLREVIQEDIRVQADRLKLLLDQPPAALVPTTGTITASANTNDEAWREELRAELRRIVEKLERLSERMDEIYRI